MKQLFQILAKGMYTNRLILLETKSLTEYQNLIDAVNNSNRLLLLSTNVAIETKEK